MWRDASKQGKDIVTMSRTEGKKDIRTLKKNGMLLLFLLFTGAVLLASLALGSARIHGRLFWGPWGRSQGTQEMVIWNIRLPRNLVGALVGADLAVSGAILQAVMKIPWRIPASWVFPAERGWPV